MYLDLALTFIVDLAISINISFSDHFIYFFICQLLSQISHYMTQFCCTDVTIAILKRDKWSLRLQHYSLSDHSDK